MGKLILNNYILIVIMVGTTLIGIVSGILGSIITLRKEALIESEKMLKIATTSANIGLWELKTSTGDVTWNDKSYEIFGIEKGTNITYEVWSKLLHPDDLVNVKNEIENAIHLKINCNVVFRIIRLNGEIRTIQGTGAPLFKNDVLEKIIGTNIDLTDHLKDDNCKV